jgi:hypothetical protein
VLHKNYFKVKMTLELWILFAMMAMALAAPYLQPVSTGTVVIQPTGVDAGIVGGGAVVGQPSFAIFGQPVVVNTGGGGLLGSAGIGASGLLGGGSGVTVAQPGVGTVVGQPILVNSYGGVVSQPVVVSGNTVGGGGLLGEPVGISSLNFAPSNVNGGTSGSFVVQPTSVVAVQPVALNTGDGVSYFG